MQVLSRFVRSPAGRLALILLVALSGFAAAQAGGIDDLGRAPWYMWAVSALLAVGLYGSASGIPADAVKDLRTVVLAVTVGVVLKTVLIAAVMYIAAGHRPAAMVLGVAVAQIDPLSVVAIIGRSQMSKRAKSLLLAWASFDDPVTALLTIYLVTFALGGGSAASVEGIPGYAVNLALNLGFAAVVWACWWLARSAVSRRAARRAGAPAGGRRPVRARAVSELPAAFRVAATLVLLILLAVAAWRFLMLGVALIGLFYRPGIEESVERATTTAFFVATFALGLLLPGGIDLRLGVVLGVAAFGAQVVAGLLIARRLTLVDRVYLALGQQNGITAVILALALQPYLPYAVSVVAPAILVVNVMNIATNGVWDRRAQLARWYQRRPALAGRAAPAAPPTLAPSPVSAPVPAVAGPERPPSRLPGANGLPIGPQQATPAV